MVLLRRELAGTPAISEQDVNGRRRVGFATLVTSLDAAIPTLGQLYRDRGDRENDFDK